MWTPLLVGLYETLLGICFLLNRIRLALVLFVPRQLIAFSTLLLIPSVAFNDPMPFAYDQFGAFTLKNVVFIIHHPVHRTSSLCSPPADFSRGDGM